MAPWKRPPHLVDRDRDGEAPGNKSKRRQGASVAAPAQIGVTRGNGLLKEDDKLVEKIFGPMIRRVVGEELATALRRHLHRGPSPSGHRKKTLQLRLKGSPSDTYTGVKVEAKKAASLEVALYQCDAAGVEDRIVTEGPLSSTGIELCLLHGSFGSDGREDWSSEDFRRNIVHLTRKGGKLLSGNLFLRLRNGVCTVENLCVNDISTWARTEHFRLGAKVAEPTPETESIREGISKPFRVKDCRGLGYQKPDTPSLNDGIWRLKGIRKDGKRHKLLQSKGINTVEAFLHQFNTDPNQLKQEIRVGEKAWRKLILHANEACPKQDAGQPYLPTAPLNSEPQQAGQGQPQHELLLPVTPQGWPSTSQWHSGEAVHAGQQGEVSHGGGDIESWVTELLNPPPAHEGHSGEQFSWPNSGIYISNRGGGTTIWRQIRSAVKATWTWLRFCRAKRKGKLVPRNYKIYSPVLSLISLSRHADKKNLTSNS
ncbi:calmodulin-binding protein 60 D [Neltuma alba]|uniref:calmodulin-binding protein 60 D n=1 Tax=Neltuma alba TaxID=207710 RepID=UPI0010A542D4|nr:calmodulin-binding protein 60 D-like [Prosopis alba]